MNIGGCGAVTACDVSIYLALNKGWEELYPFDVHDLTPRDYVRFTQIMKPYLRPRAHGIDTLDLWIDGYMQYLEDQGETKLALRGMSGDCSLDEIEEAVRTEIDNGMPVPYLNLRHINPNMANYVWHWFWLAGYCEYEGTFMVKIVTYGRYWWISLNELWDTGYKRKGGIILFSEVKA